MAQPTSDYKPAGDAPAGDKPADEEKSVPHPHVGLNAERGCTDILAWVLLIAGIGVMGWMANMAFTNGKPMRLLLGTDYLGNICGEDPVPANLTGLGAAEWHKRNIVWYPLTFDFKQKKLLVEEALKLGVCVSACPAPGSLVKPYGAAGTEAPPPWLVLFNSTPTLHRCMPDLFTFDCQGDSGCSGILAGSNSTFASAAAVGNFVNGAMDEVRKYFWTIYVGVAICIVFCFIWMMLLRRILTVFVKLTLFLVFVLLAACGVVCQQMHSKPDVNPDRKDWYLAGMILGFGLALGFLILMYFIWRDIMIACDIIEESTRVPVDIPSLIFLPPATLLFVIIFASFAVIVSVFIQASGENLDFTLPVPNFLNSSDTKTASLVNSSGDTSLKNINFNSTFTVKELTFPNWRPYAHVYNLFFFLWMFGLMNAICFMCISLCTVYWYFSNPGDRKTPPLGAVLVAFKTVLRYHIGTVAFGSLLVAIIQTVRIVLAIVEKKMQEAKELNDTAKCMFKLAQCCLGYLEWVVKFINKNAYIVQAISGKSFFPAAKKALELIGHNAMSVGALTIISEYVILFGKVLITAISLILSWLVISNAASDGISGGIILMLIIGILSFFIACLFANIFSVCIDTMLICYCWDRDEPGLNYFPDDLAKHVEAMQTRKAAADAGKTAADVAAKSGHAEPMKEMTKAGGGGGGDIDL